MAGIGKTALIERAAAFAADQGAQVAMATGRQLESGFPFGIALQLFEPAIAALDRPEAERVLSGAASPVAALLRGPGGGAPVPDQAFAIIHGLYWLTVNLSERAPLVLLVDDVHWGDLPSLQALAYLAPRAEELPLLVVMGRRTGEPGSSQLDWLGSAPALSVLQPATLSAEATGEMVRAIVGAGTGDALCEACYEATGGNPFLVGELARTIRADALDREHSPAEIVARLAPESVSRSTLSRIQALDPAARSLAAALAVLERAELRHAAALAGLDEAATADAAAALAATGVLASELPLRFSHPLLRTAVYADLAAAGRQLSHRRAARLLWDAGADPDVVASHLLQSDPREESWAVDALRAAARAALARGVPQISARLLKRALAESPRHPDRSTMLLERAQAYLLGGHRRTSAALAEVVDTSEDPLTRASALAALGTISLVTGDVAAAAAVARRGLDDIAERHSAELEVRLLLPYMASAYGDPELARELAAALSRAEPARWTPADSARAVGLGFTLALRGDPVSEVIPVVRQGLADERLMDLGFEGFTLGAIAASVLAAVGHLDEAIAAVDKMSGIAQERGSGVLRGAAANASAWCRWVEQGLVPEALAEIELLEAITPPWHGSAAFGYLLHCDVLIDRSELADAAHAMASAEGLLSRTRHYFTPFWHPFVRSRLRLEHGDAEGALADALRAGEACNALGVQGPAWCAWRSRAALAAARLDDSDQARRLCDEELRLARRSAVRRAVGTALHTLGLIGPGDERIATLRQACDVLAGSPFWLGHARALVDLGAALRRDGRRSDAAEPLRRGMSIAHRCGAIAVVERARSELRAMGSRPRRLVVSGRESLTPSELRICELVAKGLNNRQIAERLFITRRTVETHLTHAYQKLEITSRTQIGPALQGDLATPR